MSGIQRVSHTHNEICDFMLANPVMNLGDVAKHFGYTQGWLSQIIHSDAFQVMLKEKQLAAFNHTVLPLREKMEVAAHMAMDKLIATLPLEVDTRTISNVADSMLDRLGFSAKPIGNGGVTINQQNNFTLNSNADEIARARELMLAKTSSLGVTNVVPPGALPGASPAPVGANVLEGDFSSAEGTHDFGKEGIAS